MRYTKHIFYTIALLLLGFTMVSCDDFLDINDNPNELPQASLRGQLPPVIEGTSRSHYELANSAGQITQQIGSYFLYPTSEDLRGQAGTSWENIYLRNVANLNGLISQAETEGSPHYAGVGRVLLALNLGLLTDNWEDVPYTNASLEQEDLQPAYDLQASIYMSIEQLLDSALVSLQATSSRDSPGDDDLAYGGDLMKWAQLAYALKARYKIHLWNRTQDASIFEDIVNAFASNGEDFEITYNSRVKNPWHQLALGVNTGNLVYTYGSYFVDQLNSLQDPRLYYLIDTTGSKGSVVGITAYDMDAPSATVNFQETTFYTLEDSPIPMVTYAELKFIEAEAAFRSDQPDRAYSAYLEGIEAHMQKINVPDSLTSVYLSAPNISVGAANLTLHEIMREKYVALFLNPEQWVDMRRHNYDASVYPNYVIPDVATYGGPAQRILYPISETSRNAVNAAAAAKPFGTPMWRDQ